MTEEELAKDYAFMHYGDTDNDGNPLTDDIIMQRSFLAGYEQAKRDLSCVRQRLNMLEEHNMTIDDVIASLENHNEIHSRQEPRAYYITKALNIAIDFLKNHRWHYPSKMENGKYIEDNPIADFYPIEILAFYPDKRKYEIIKYDSSWMYYQRTGESLSSRTNFIWQYMPEPLENEDNLCEVF